MKKKSVLFLGGVIIAVMSIIVIFSWKVSQLSKEKELELRYPEYVKSVEWAGVGGGAVEDRCFVVSKGRDVSRYFSLPYENDKYMEAAQRFGQDTYLSLVYVTDFGEKPENPDVWYNSQKMNVMTYDFLKKNHAEGFYRSVSSYEEELGFDYKYSGSVVRRGVNGEGYLFLKMESDSKEIAVKYIAMKVKTTKYIISTEYTITDTDTPDFVVPPDSEYQDQLSNADWESYKKQQAMVEYDALNPRQRGFRWSVSGLNDNSVVISMNTSALPDNNDKLYSRYPGLSKWRYKEDLSVGIVIGGRPTAEEIQSMFVEEP